MSHPKIIKAGFKTPPLESLLGRGPPKRQKRESLFLLHIVFNITFLFSLFKNFISSLMPAFACLIITKAKQNRKNQSDNSKNLIQLWPQDNWRYRKQSHDAVPENVISGHTH